MAKRKGLFGPAALTPSGPPAYADVVSHRYAVLGSNPRAQIRIPHLIKQNAPNGALCFIGGEEGIRTLVGRKPSTDFESVPL